jgi:pentatricopeptide repeat protein
MKALAAERAKHSRPPGSRAGKKREWEAFLREDLLNRKFGEEFRDPLAEAPYDAADAILDDFMGNSAGISSQPTPEPVYLGHKHRQFYRRVADQMDAVRYYEEQVKLLEEGGDGSAAAKDIALAEAPALPTDRDVSLVLRAYRDKRGTRRHPVGLHGALRHVVGDLGVPLSAWSENTYTALITCCRTAREARRVVQLMQQHRVPVSPHAWSSLADVYAKAGDYQGCLEVHKDMLAAGVPPTLASYTSLLAACYKVCSDGRVPHSTRAEAATTAWEQWQEMRVVGLQPDAMAYGAMLRVLAIKGQAEKAMGLLEEMQMQDVKPTTLCFTSALRAVARSHAIAVRYERGSSKKMRRREHLTLHHGKMARQILIAAENAEVEQDQGFTAALIMCAASAGDVATAKAIYVASQIRQLDQFRTIGSEQHLARLRGESVGESDDDQLLTSGEPIRQIGASSAVNGSQFQTQRDHSVVNGSSDLLSTNGERAPARRKKQNKSYPSFGEREYGKDNRALTAIVHACAASVDQNGMGSMWQGRENNGYLCENSLRLINARRLPRYTDNSIPGQTIKDNLTWKGEHHELDDNYDYGKRKGKARRKFEGLDIVEDAGSTLDELDETFSRMFLDEEGRRKPEYRATEPEDIWRMKYGEGYDPEEESPAQERGGEKAMLHDGFTATTMLSASSAEESSLDGEEEMYFDNDEMKWKNRPRFDVSENIADTEFVEKSNISEQVKDQTEEELHFDLDATRWKTRPKAAAATDASAYKLTGEEMHQDEEENRSSLCSEDDTELYFDEDEMKWKTRERAARKTDYETDVLTGRREVAIHEEEAGDAKVSLHGAR